MVNNEMPVFVKIDEYKDILDVVELMKNKVAQARETLRKIEELNNQEDSELESWKTNLEEIERKVGLIDTSLLEPESI
jgi:hypothetical protein